MPVIIESSIWKPGVIVHLFLFFACFFSVALFPLISGSRRGRVRRRRRSSALLDPGGPPSYRRTFLLLYALASACEGVWSVFGDSDPSYTGAGRDGMLWLLSAGYIAAVLTGISSGVLSDLIGHRSACLGFWILHLVIALCRSAATIPPLYWVTKALLSFTTTLFSSNFESWLALDHDKPERIHEVFWFMTLIESATSIGSQALVNGFIRSGSTDKNAAVCASKLAGVLAILGFLFTIIAQPNTTPYAALSVDDYKRTFADRRVVVVMLAQSCVHFSVAYFWLLWAPTMVADGRGVDIGLVRACLYGARMLGSSLMPWLTDTAHPLLLIEDCLIYAFAIASMTTAIVAYDYQELGYLLLLFCFFNVCMGVAAPALARLRSTHVPSHLRGGVMGLSTALGNAAVLLFLLRLPRVSNSSVLAVSALSMASASSLMYLLKHRGKQQLHSSRDL